MFGAGGNGDGMKKGEIYEGAVERLKFPNKGVTSPTNADDAMDGEVVVKNALPGQKIRFQLTKKRKGRMEGKLVEVLQPSPLENQKPFCPHFGECGGCSYQTMDYGNQIALKSGQVKALLDSVCDGYEFEGISGSPSPYAYRNKMEFSFGDEYKGGPLALGLHKRGSFYDIVPVSDCRIVHPDVNLVVKAAGEFLAGCGVGFYHKISHEGYLRHLLVRRASHTGEMLVALVTSSQCAEERAIWEGFREAVLSLELEGEVTGVLHMRNDALSDVVKSEATTILYGRDYIREKLYDLSFHITPFSFFQTNTLGAEVLYDKVKEYMGEVAHPTILDLYSGTGTIAQTLAPMAERVIGVEIVAEAVVAARESASRNGLSGCEFLEGDVLRVLKEWEGKPDFIVLDPPREGIHPKALKKIMEFEVDAMVYVSCKPTSLARDLEMLQEGGYRLVKAACVDMFAWGRNVETVVLLSKLKSDGHI